MLGVAGYLSLKAKKVWMCMRYLDCKASHLLVFVSDIYRYVPIQISNLSGDISLEQMIGALNTDLIIFRKSYIWTP